VRVCRRSGVSGVKDSSVTHRLQRGTGTLLGGGDCWDLVPRAQLTHLDGQLLPADVDFRSNDKESGQWTSADDR
jgi:hypothetical protein